jgi:hypothetical protein
MQKSRRQQLFSVQQILIHALPTLIRSCLSFFTPTRVPVPRTFGNL